MRVEPVPAEPAATATVAGDRALILADYHAGLEQSMREQGLEVPSRATARRSTVLRLVEETDADRVVFLGDLATAIGDPPTPEREELLALLTALDVPVTVVKGNHDGDIEDVLAAADVDGEVVSGAGTRIGDVGFAHGHTWPTPAVLEAPTVCVAHEHPMVRLEDEVGGRRVERVWLRGRLDPEPFRTFHDDDAIGVDGSLVLFPAFNDLTAGTWVNVESQEFLSPFLPAGLTGGEAYLLDGTRLGDYRDL